MAFLFCVEYIRQAIWCEDKQRHYVPLPLDIKGFPLLHIEGLLPPVVCRRTHVKFTLFLSLHMWCPTHNVLCFSFVCLRLVYHMLPVSLDCPFVIASSVFSNGYLCICKQLHSGNCLRTMIVFNFKDVLISVFTNGINLIHFSLINVSQLWCNG